MQIDGHTQLVGIIGNPITQVRTPQLFNASVAKQGLNVVCLPLHVESAQLNTIVSVASAVKNMLGLIVTIPHKEAVVAACATLTDTARLVGSVNAMRFDHATKTWIGGNFDGDGFVAGLRERGHSLAGKRVLLLGAGGAGKAMAYAIAREQPAILKIFNRSFDKAAKLAERLKTALPAVEITACREISTLSDDIDVGVNSTSLGLDDADPLPFPAERLRAGMLVCEAVVRDGGTALLKTAQANGCTVHHGQWMLYGQAVEIARFLGVPLTAECVDRALGPTT